MLCAGTRRWPARVAFTASRRTPLQPDAAPGTAGFPLDQGKGSSPIWPRFRPVDVLDGGGSGRAEVRHPNPVGCWTGSAYQVRACFPDRRGRGGTSRGGGRGSHPAIVRAHECASALSTIPGKRRRNSTAAANSPPSAKASRMAVMVASSTMNMSEHVRTASPIASAFLGAPPGLQRDSHLGHRPDD